MEVWVSAQKQPPSPSPHGAPAGENRCSPGKHTCLPQVYYLGEGETSRRWLQQEPHSKAELCLSHMEAVASHVRARHPATTPLVWDDMLRDIPGDQLAGGPGGGPSWGPGVGWEEALSPCKEAPSRSTRRLLTPDDPASATFSFSRGDTFP